MAEAATVDSQHESIGDAVVLCFGVDCYRGDVPFVVDDHCSSVACDSAVLVGDVVDPFVSPSQFVVVHRRGPWFCVDLFVDVADRSNMSLSHLFNNYVCFIGDHERSRCCQLIRASGALRYRGVTSDGETNSSRNARG